MLPTSLVRIPANRQPAAARGRAAVGYSRLGSRCSQTLHTSGKHDEWCSRNTVCLAAETDKDSKVDGWAKAREMFAAGEVFDTTVRGVNKGGVLVDCWGVSGFIPNSMVSPSGRPEEGMRVRALFVEVDELQNRMILSQRMVLQAELLKTLTPGDIVEGKVSWIESYGAFVDIALKDGRTVSGLVHKSELSWKTVIVPESVVAVGEWVKCVVVDVNPGRGRVSLSLRQTQPDPLKVNLETMMASDVAANAQWTEAEAPLPGLETVISTLTSKEGIKEVKAGRQASVPGVVSQDLELWLSKAQTDGHFTVVARANSDIQEIHVYATLSQEEIRAAIDDALSAAL